jgi:photosystem II stability/assembly factor-like uncharacterized protein
MKWFYSSNDGGLTWNRWKEPPSGGYLDDLAVVSVQRSFIGLGRGTLLGTLDGGLSWRDEIDTRQANPADASGWRLLFLQQRYGWAALQNQIFRTQDGGETWELIQVH